MATIYGALLLPLRAGLAAGALLLAPTGAAQAQFFGYGHDYGHAGSYSFWGPHYRRPPVVLEELEPREIVAELEARGFSRVSRPVYREDVAFVRAVNPAGYPVRLTIDIFSGRIVARELDRSQPRPQVAQRAPGQGPAIRDAVPEIRTPSRAAPEPTLGVRREPVAPRQTAPSGPPVNEKIVRPEKPAPTAQPPEASAGTRQQPRRIEIVPPAPLDAPAATKPAEAPINSVPPAPLE